MMFHDREWWLAVGLVLLAALGGFLGSLIRAFDEGEGAARGGSG